MPHPIRQTRKQTRTTVSTSSSLPNSTDPLQAHRLLPAMKASRETNRRPATPPRHNSATGERTATTAAASSSSSRFLPVRLTPARLDAFHSAAHKALTHTVKEFVKLDNHAIDTQRWRYLRSRNGASAYHDRREGTDPQHASLLVAGMIQARLADVMDGLYMETSEDTRLVQHRLHPRFVDAEVLAVMERQSTPERPHNFTGLKWALLQSSRSGMVSNRDICFFEKLGTLTIAGGRTLGYFIMQSVNLVESPPSLSAKTVRAHISLCYLFEETKHGLVGAFMTGTMVSFGPKMLWKMARNNFADITLSIGNAVDVAHAKRFAQLVRSRSEAHDSPSSTAQRSLVCELCHGFPTFFERHRQCTGCHKKSVCKKCRVKREVFHRHDHTSLRLARAAFCFDCVESVRRPTSAQPAVQRQRQPPLSRPQPRPERKDKQGSGASDSRLSTSSTPSHGYVKADSLASSAATGDSEHGSLNELELERDSERSLGIFMRKVQEQLDDVKYGDYDPTARLSELAMLGSGMLTGMPCGSNSGSESTNSDDRASGLTSFTSSAFSVCDDDLELSYGGDDENIQSIRPVRRSLQPPEMLEAQKLSWDGSLRPQARSVESDRHLLERLVEASRLAEQTHRLTKEQAQRSERHATTARYPGSITL